MKKESINTILGNTNYQSKKSQTKFNSIGKLISTNLESYNNSKSEYNINSENLKDIFYNSRTGKK